MSSAEIIHRVIMVKEDLEMHSNAYFSNYVTCFFLTEMKIKNEVEKLVSVFSFNLFKPSVLQKGHWLHCVSLDTDQTPQVAASDQDLHCLHLGLDFLTWLQ